MNTDSTPKSGSLSPVICIFGPTAVGKTSLLESLFGGTSAPPHPSALSCAWYSAARDGGYRTGEVISADSMQVYRGLDIGTAKPSAALLSVLPHHLLDIKSPSEQYSAGDFVRDADEAVALIRGKGLLPVISGGTAFYFQNYLHGLPQAPAIDQRIRDSVQEDLAENGITNLYAELMSVDPISANRIPISDVYRITRAIEVYRMAGKPLSSFSRQSTFRPGIDPLVIGLTRPREELAERISQRVDTMIRLGLEREVQDLLKGGLDPSAPGLRAIGYKELADSAEGLNASTVERIKRNTRRYAKRQLTFFRSFSSAQWFSPENKELIVEAIKSYIDRIAAHVS